MFKEIQWYMDEQVLEELQKPLQCRNFNGINPAVPGAGKGNWQRIQKGRAQVIDQRHELTLTQVNCVTWQSTKRTPCNFKGWDLSMLVRIKETGLK